MAEGERPNPAGAHHWNKESTSDAVKRMQAEQAREQADLKLEYRSLRQ